MRWQCRDQTLQLQGDGVIMGILNVTPDSFSDGGRFEAPDHALAHAASMIADGAAIIDIGGESTRPGAAEVSPEEEMRRVVPVVAALHAAHPGILLSIDTSKAAVARAACQAGAHIINDVTGLRGDPEMVQVAAETRAGLVIMHMQGTPRTMQSQPRYHDVIAEITAFLRQQIAFATNHGVASEQLVIDPGIGFGKTLEHNLQILQRLDAFAALNRPLLLGVSRKSFFGTWLEAGLEDRLPATVAVTALARTRGVHLHRVHDVRANRDALRVARGMEPGK